MTPLQLLGKLGANGIKLWLDDNEQLRFKAPKGAMTESLKADIIAQKPNLIALLQETTNTPTVSIRSIKRQVNAEYPLSFSQERFWFLDRLEPGNASLHIPAALRLQGNIDLKVLETAFNALIERHESLRTYFVSDKDHQVSQKVAPSLSISLKEAFDLSHLDEDRALQQAKQIIKEDALKPFQLEASEAAFNPLFRLQLIRLAHSNTQFDGILLINLHHIIADGLSLNVLITELFAGYKQQLATGTIEFSPLPLQYIDYAHHQKGWMDSQAKDSELRYWQAQLNNTPQLDLPTQFKRPDHLGFHGSSATRTLSIDLSKTLLTTFTNKPFTDFTGFFSAFYLLLARLSNQDDFALGTPVAGRQHSQLEGIVGCFINLLAIRCNIDDTLTFDAFASQCQQVLADAQAHQTIPFELVADGVATHRDLSRHPIFQALFTYQEQAIANNALGDNSSVNLLPLDSVTAKVDLQCHVEKKGDRLNITFEYNTELFIDAQIQDFLRHYEHLLASIAENPEAQVYALNLFDESDFTQFLPILKSANEAKKLLVDRIEKTRLKKPDHIAVSQGAQSITHKELHDKATSLARALIEKGAKPHTRIALLLPPGIDAIVSLLAIMKTGAVYVPLDTSYPQQRIDQIIAQAEPLLVITDKSGSLSLLTASTLCLDDFPYDEAEALEELPLKLDAPFYTIFTSGSTGLPKGVSVSQANIYNLIYWYKEAYKFTSADKFLVISALGFDLTQKNLLLPLLLGAEIVFPDTVTYDPRRIIDTLYQSDATIINCVPSAFYPLVDESARSNDFQKMASLRQVLFGGEPINLTKLKPWINSKGFMASIGNMYGPTECTDIATTFDIKPLDAFYEEPIPIGQPIDGVSLYILDAYQQLQPVGTPGELHIGGSGLSLGYFNQEELTSNAFIHNPYVSRPDAKLYKTGDKAKYQRDENGQLRVVFLGRLDDQIKIRGHRVEPQEIAKKVEGFSGIKESLVTVKDIAGSEQLVAYYLPEDDASIDLFHLKNYLTPKLPAYMLPQAYVPIHAWPLSANGKIDVKALPAPDSAHKLTQTYVAPETLLEKQLCSLFAQKLGQPEIGILDNFFELGGHSILVVQLLGTISDELGVDIDVRTFFDHPTVSTLSKVIESGHALDTPASSPLVPMDKGDQIPLSASQERLWVIEQMTQNHTAYLIPFVVKLQGAVRFDLLKQAIALVISRHESLRTSIKIGQDGLPKQQLLSPEAVAIEDLSLPDQPPTDMAALLTPWLTNAFNEGEPLFRIGLKALKADEVIVAATLHHMIGDAWSLAVFKQDLLEAYDKLLAGKEASTPLTLQYSDFALWQRDYLSSPKARDAEDYWISQLSDAPPALQLPYDKPQPETPSFHGRTLSAQLDTETYQALTSFCQSSGMTVYPVLLSAYYLVLHHYTQKTDIVIGAPVAGRDHPELQRLIGYFINALAIRLQPEKNINFEALCLHTLDKVLGAINHQDIPIEQVIKKLPNTGDLQQSPITQLGFNLIEESLFDSSPRDDFEIQTLALPLNEAKYDLTLTCVQHQDGITLNAEYNTDLFVEATIQALLGHFTGLLNQCLKAPQDSLTQLDVLGTHSLLSSLQLTHKRGKRLPLNAMQHDMLLMQSLHPEARANTLGYRIEIPFSVDASLWQQALQQVHNDQATCRTEFLMNPLPMGKWGYQWINDASSIHFDSQDLRQDNLDKTVLDERVNAFIYQGKAYEKGQFFRYALWQLSNDRTLVLMSCHHAILDGISVSILAQQHIAYYEALVANKAKPAPLHFDIEAFTRKNRALLDTPDTLNFWRNQLKACDPLHYQGTGLEREALPHRIHQLAIPGSDWQAIKAFCKKAKTTPALFFKVAYAFLVAEYCRAESAFYLTEFHAKRNNNTDKALGCLFQQTPFVVHQDLLEANASFSDWLKSARHLQKQAKPFSNISKQAVSAISPAGTLSFMYNYYHFLPETFDILGEKAPCAETPPLVEGAVQFIVKALDSGTRVELYAEPHQFDGSSFLERLMMIVKQAMQDDLTRGNLKLLQPAEFVQQVYHLQPQAKPPAPEFQVNSVANLLTRQAQLTPDAIALETSTNTFSFAELEARTNQLGHYLKQQGVGPDVKIGIYLDRSADAILAILGVIKAGGAYAPIDTRHPSDRVNIMLQAAGIDKVFAHQEVKLALASRFDLKDSYIQDQLQSLPTHSPDTQQQPNDLLYVIFTSGSTGQSKACGINHSSVLNLQQWYLDSVGANIHSRFLLMSALGFDLTQKNILAPLISGGRLVLDDQPFYDSERIADLIQSKHITHLNCAPSAFYPLIEEGNELDKLTSLQDVIFGGEPITLARLSPWLAHPSNSARLTNHYGPTECTDIALYYPVKTIDANSGGLPLGKPNSNVQVYILNGRQCLVPQGQLGEIAIGGAGVSRGYINNETLNQQVFIPNPFGPGQLYLTGDLGYWNHDDQVVFAGRKDFQLKINGQRVDPADIEYQLKQLTNIQDACVVSHRGKLIAYVLTQEPKQKVDEWKAALSHALPAYMMPTSIIPLTSWPLNANGKLDRKALPEPETPKAKALIKPRDSIEESLCAILKQTLGLDQLSVDDDLFSLGANSLSASRAFVQIRDKHQLDMPLNLLFELTTIEKLAEFIHASKQVTIKQADEPARVTGSI